MVAPLQVFISLVVAQMQSRIFGMGMLILSIIKTDS